MPHTGAGATGASESCVAVSRPQGGSAWGQKTSAGVFAACLC